MGGILTVARGSLSGLGSLITRTPAASFAYGPINAAQLSDGTILERTYRMEHTALVSGDGLRLVYVNTHNVPIIIRAGVEPTLNATPVEVVFDSETEITIQPHTSVQSDVIPDVTLVSGSKFATRTRVSVASSGQKWMLGERNFGGTGKGGVANGDLHLSGSISSSGVYLFGPAKLTLDYPSDDAIKTVAVIMDSFGGGWPVSAFEGIYPTGFFSRNGEAAFTFLNSTGAQGSIEARRNDVYPLLADFDNVVEGYGTNDRSSNRTAIQIKNDRLTIWSQIIALYPDIRIIAATIAPRTTSTDAWATTVNQTVTTGEAIRLDVNTWLRGGAPIDPIAKTVVSVGTSGALLAGQVGHPLHSIFELADVIESVRDSGLWAPGTTTDGIHPGTTARATIGSAFPVEILAV
jgi:hypothetical protein